MTKHQLAIIIMVIETGSIRFLRCVAFRILQRQTKEALFIELETILKPYKKYTRKLKIAFDIARVKLPGRI